MLTKTEIEQTGMSYKNSGVDCSIYVSSTENGVFLVGGYYNDDQFVEAYSIELIDVDSTKKRADKELGRSVKKLDNAIKEAIKLKSSGLSENPISGAARAIINLKANFN